MATHSSVLAWRIPGTAGPNGLPSMGSHRVGHDWSDLAAAPHNIHKNKSQIDQRFKGENKTLKNLKKTWGVFNFYFQVGKAFKLLFFKIPAVINKLLINLTT